MSRANKPIYPQAKEIRRDDQRPTHLYASGMTLLEHYAGLAMQGVLASDVHDVLSEKIIIDRSISHARALIAELEKQTP